MKICGACERNSPLLSGQGCYTDSPLKIYFVQIVNAAKSVGK